MKKIIAVCGAQSLGKTNTINRLAYKLKNNKIDYDFNL